jgi:hypothetical protein
MIGESGLPAALPSGLGNPLTAEHRGITTAYLEGRSYRSALSTGRWYEV